MFAVSFKALVISFVSMLFLVTQVEGLEVEKISLQLQQSIDANCDGIADTNYSSRSYLEAIPQQCIMYKVSLKNTADHALRHIVISGKIPPYTQLIGHSVRLYKNDKLQVDNTISTNYSVQINSSPITLPPDEAIALFYSVRVD